MKKLTIIALTVVALGLSALRAQSQSSGPLTLLQTIPMPNLHPGDFDHFALDAEGKRLFLTAEENGAVEVFDLNTNKLVNSITGLKAPHSMLYRGDVKKLFVVDSDLAAVKIFETDTYKPVGSIKMLDGADSSAYDPASKYLYVVNGGSDANLNYTMISVVDTTAEKKVGDIKFDTDAIEAMAIEKGGPRMWVNVTGKNSVAVVDREKRIITAEWPIAQEGKHNAALAFDEANHRLFVFTRRPGNMIVMDSDSGKVLDNQPCFGQTDDAVFDPASKRLYVIGVPYIYVYQERNPKNVQLLGMIPTTFHTVTGILVPELHRYYAASPGHGDVKSQVLVYRVNM
jgi:DNA-binding beta-propeller fold protein YncE